MCAEAPHLLLGEHRGSRANNIHVKTGTASLTCTTTQNTMPQSMQASAGLPIQPTACAVPPTPCLKHPNAAAWCHRDAAQTLQTHATLPKESEPPSLTANAVLPPTNSAMCGVVVVGGVWCGGGGMWGISVCRGTSTHSQHTRKRLACARQLHTCPATSALS
jgi:hypothetical protein